MKDFLEKFKESFNDAFYNNLNYDQIKKRVIITKDYENRGLVLHSSHFVTILVLIVLLGGVILMLATKRVICMERRDHYVDFNNVQESVEWADYVFIAKVERKLYTRQYDGTGLKMPYSYYELTGIVFLKCEGLPYDKLLFYGGYNFLNQLIVFKDNQILPEPGEYYLFTVQRTIASQQTSRLETDSYFVVSDGQMRLLEGYIPTKSLEEQNDKCKDIINPYLDALNAVK